MLLWLFLAGSVAGFGDEAAAKIEADSSSDPAGESIVLALPGADNNTEVNSVLASVDGEAITLFDVLPLTRSREFQAAAVYSGDRLREAVSEIRREAVESLIDRKLIIADYQAQPFTILNRDIEAELDAVAERLGCRSRSEFAARLRRDGSSLEEVREEVREHIIVQLMLSRQFQIRTSVTPRELREYYNAHPEEFSTPESVELAMLKVPRSRSDFAEVCAEVGRTLAEAPERFDDLARRFAVPAAPDGGKLGVIELKRLRVEFAAALKDIAPGKIYGPIEIEDGTVWLKVIDHIQASEGDFESRAPEIRRRLENEQYEAERREYSARLREQAVIRYFF